MITNRKIDRAKLAEKFAELRDDPSFPTQVKDGLDFWLKDDANEIHAQPEAELHKAIESIKLILADTKAPEYQPAAENAPRRDSESCGLVSNLDDGSLVEQRAKSDRGRAVTNAEFIRNIFGRLPQDHSIATTHFPDVAKPKWVAAFYRPDDMPDHLGENTYYSPSSFNGKKRNLDHFGALHVLVLDDITPGRLAALPPPTYALETSAENYQVGYALQTPVTDLPLARAIHQALQGAGYCDNNGNNPVRWVRLPVGMNTKPGKMFQHIMKTWAPDQRYDVLKLVEVLGLKLDAEGTAEAPTLGLADPFAHMVEPKLQQPGVLAKLLQKLDADVGRDDWRVVLSCIYTHLGEDGRTVAHDWCATGAKFMIDRNTKHTLKHPEADVQFQKVWNEIAAENKSNKFRRGGDDFLGLMKRVGAMTSGDIASWHAENRASEAKTPPPENFTLRGHFANHTLTNKDAEKMEQTKFIYPKLIPQGLITAYPSPANGGKTAIFTHAACRLAKEGYEVFYINADASPSQLKSQQEKADKHGFSILAPDAKDAGGVAGLLKTLTDLGQMDVSLNKAILMVDTLKKFVDMLDKGQLKSFINLLRKLVAKGATVCLLVHTNKYLTPDGHLIYEGTADLRNDIDNMIYLYSSLAESGVREVTSNPDKTRTTFEPISFRIRFGDMGVTVEELDVVLPCFTDELRSVFNAVVRSIDGGTRAQEGVVAQVAEELMLGVNKAREKIKEVADLKNSPLIRQRVANAPGFSFSYKGEAPHAYGEF